MMGRRTSVSRSSEFTRFWFRRRLVPGSGRLSFSTPTPCFSGPRCSRTGFGLRHAVDADHIAAIDNVTRKLMQDGKRPVAVGFFFSLGHSTVVILLSALVALTATALQTRFEMFKHVGGIIGTSVSAFFPLPRGDHEPVHYDQHLPGLPPCKERGAGTRKRIWT